MPKRAALCLATLVALLASTAPTLAGAPKEPTVEDPIVIKSFDGTPIVATLMLPADASKETPVPAVLQTHGWGGTRQVTPDGLAGRLLDSGYAVLTWDSRGFGASGGEANVGSPDFEVKDAQELIDYLAKRPEIALEAPGDPLLGWVGGSNAAGVQFNTAAVERRIDAIVPEISWGDLVGDLVPGDVGKQSWDELLYVAGAASGATGGIASPAGPQTGVYAREIHVGSAQLNSTGQIDAQIRKWFAHKSTTKRSSKIKAPTLIIQGSIDTLFPLEDGFANYLNLKKAGTPVKLMTYCSGHMIAGCSYPGGASGYPEGNDERAPIYQDRIVAWLDRYVKGRNVETGPEIEWQAQDGIYYGAPRYPLPGTKWFHSKPVSTGTLVGPGPGGGDGAADGNPAPAEELGRSAARVVVYPKAKKSVDILGVPHVTISGSATGVTAFAFFELVDVAPDGTRVTLDDQVMPLRLTGDVGHELDLHGVSWRLLKGHALELEVTTGSTQYQIPRTGPFAISLDVVAHIPTS